MLSVNRPAGNVIEVVFVNKTVALLLLASILPEVKLGATPAKVNVFAPTVSVPLASVRLLAIDPEPPNVIPVDLFKVTLLKLNVPEVIVLEEALLKVTSTALVVPLPVKLKVPLPVTLPPKTN